MVYQKNSNLYIEVLDVNRLNDSARKGIIALLPKSGKDRTFLKSWRPLTFGQFRL